MAQSVQVKKIGWWHERLADWMIANPELTLGDAAKFFQCSRSWLSIVKNSDCFKIYWSTRSGDFSQHLNDRTADTIMGIKEKTAGVTELALDEIGRRLELEAEILPMGSLLDITKMGQKALGYTATANTASPTVNVNVGLVSAETLEKARERAKESFGLKAEPARAVVSERPPIDPDAAMAEILEE